MTTLLELDQAVVAAAILTIIVFIVGELTVGVARAAGQDAWKWAKRRVGRRTRKDQTSRP